MSQVAQTKNAAAIDQRAVHTLLAALRHWQRTSHVMELDEIASNGGEVDPLNDAEIDDLCELLNSGILDSAVDPQEPQNLQVDDLLFVGSSEVRQWLVASLFYWRQEGQCEPFNRTEGIQAIATGNDQFTSASESDIDELLIRLHSDQAPDVFLSEMAGALGSANRPVVVIEQNYGSVQRVRSSAPMEVILVDLDNEMSNQDQISNFLGRNAVVTLTRLHHQADGEKDGVDFDFCQQALTAAVEGK